MSRTTWPYTTLAYCTRPGCGWEGRRYVTSLGAIVNNARCPDCGFPSLKKGKRE